MRHFVLQEIHQVGGDALAGFIGGRERAVAVRAIGFHHRHDLVQVAAQVTFANAVIGMHQWNRLAARWQRGAVVDVVHAVHVGRLPAVDFDDHLLGQVQPGLVVADRGGRHQQAVFADRRDLDDGGVDLAMHAEPDLLGDVAQVHVDVVHAPVVDALARVRVTLERQAHGDAIDLGQCAIKLGRGGSASPDLDLERRACFVGLFDARGQRQRYHLRVAGTGEAAHGDGLAVLDQRGGLFGGNNA